MTVKILLDTDIGSDVDDAVALAYLLMQPEAELLGMTTVSGQRWRKFGFRRRTWCSTMILWQRSRFLSQSDSLPFISGCLDD